MMECHHKGMVNWVRCLHILRYPNIWSPVGDTVWVGLGNVAFLEEVCQWGRALSFQKPCIVHSVLATACG